MSSPAGMSSSPRRGGPLNSRPTTRLQVFVAGGADPRELGLGKIAPKYPNSEGGTEEPILNPLLDPVTIGVVQVAAGHNHAAALTHDGKVLTWGCSDFFALGRKADGPEDEATPGPVEGLEALDAVQVVATDHATFVLTARGRVYGWGSFMVCDFLDSILQQP